MMLGTDSSFMDPVNMPWMVALEDNCPPLTENQWEQLLWDAQSGRLDETIFIVD